MRPDVNTDRQTRHKTPLVSSERMRLLASWRLWLPLLGCGILLIGIVFLIPASRRMKAIEYVEMRGGMCVYEPSPLDIVTDRLGRLGKGFREVRWIHWNRSPIAASDLEALTAIAEVETLVVSVSARIEADGIPALSALYRLESLTLQGEITTEGLTSILKQAPHLTQIEVSSLVQSEQSPAAELSDSRQLQELRIMTCEGDLALSDCPLLKHIVIDELRDSRIEFHDMPSLEGLAIRAMIGDCSIDSRQSLESLTLGSFDPLQTMPWEVPDGVRRLELGNVSTPTELTGGDQLESLIIRHCHADLTVTDSEHLQECELGWNYNPTFLRLSSLPQLQHLVLQSSGNGVGPRIELTNTPQLCAIDAPHWNDMSTTDLEQICDLPRLEHFAVSGEAITPEAVSLLAQVESLQVLSIRPSSVGERAFEMERFLEELRFPSLRIIHEAVDRWQPPVSMTPP